MSDATPQREHLNKEGDARGSLSCPGCGDSAFWKAFHVVEHGAGPIPVKDKDGRTVRQIVAQHGAAWVCEECWPTMPLADKLAALDKLIQGRVARVKSVARDRNDKGELVDIPKDLERHSREVAALTADGDALKRAVEAGA